MKLVIDANVVISALIADSKTRALIFWIATSLDVREFPWTPLASRAIERKQTPCVRAVIYPVVVLRFRPWKLAMGAAGSDSTIERIDL